MHKYNDICCINKFGIKVSSMSDFATFIPSHQSLSGRLDSYDTLVLCVLYICGYVCIYYVRIVVHKVDVRDVTYVILGQYQ